MSVAVVVAARRPLLRPCAVRGNPRQARVRWTPRYLRRGVRARAKPASLSSPTTELPTPLGRSSSQKASRIGPDPPRQLLRWVLAMSLVDSSKSSFACQTVNLHRRAGTGSQAAPSTTPAYFLSTAFAAKTLPVHRADGNASRRVRHGGVLCDPQHVNTGRVTPSTNGQQCPREIPMACTFATSGAAWERRVQSWPIRRACSPSNQIGKRGALVMFCDLRPDRGRALPLGAATPQCRERNVS